MRATFTTEFIYDGSDGYRKRYRTICEILGAPREKTRKRNMIGQIFGITNGMDISEEDIRRWIEEICHDLAKITIVQFRIVWLLEGGDLLCKEINPISQNNKYI